MKPFVYLLAIFFLFFYSTQGKPQDLGASIGYWIGGANGVSSLNIKAGMASGYFTMKLPFIVAIGGHSAFAAVVPALGAGKSFGEGPHRFYGEFGVMQYSYFFTDLGYEWAPENSNFSFRVGAGNYLEWPTATLAIDYKFLFGKNSTRAWETDFEH